MNLNLEGKYALVGGSSKGIGKAIAHQLAAQGANVSLVARSKNKLQEITHNLPTSNKQKHDYLVLDYNNPQAVLQQVTQHSKDQQRPYTILINNTGGPAGGPITEAKADEFLNAYKMHLICNQLLAQFCLQSMKLEQFGRIINIISTSVKQPIPGLGVSNTTRWAVASWAKTWANEVGQYGITVNNVLPGFTNTDRLNSIIKNRADKQSISEEAVAQNMKNSVPAQRFGQPEEIANAVGFLASPAAAYINGINLPVDGGRTKSL